MCVLPSILNLFFFPLTTIIRVLYSWRHLDSLVTVLHLDVILLLLILLFCSCTSSSLFVSRTAIFLLAPVAHPRCFSSPNPTISRMSCLDREWNYSFLLRDLPNCSKIFWDHADGNSRYSSLIVKNILFTKEGSHKESC